MRPLISVHRRFVTFVADTVQPGVDVEEVIWPTFSGSDWRHKPGHEQGRRHITGRGHFPVVTLLTGVSSYVPGGATVAFLARARSQQSGDRSDGCRGGAQGAGNVRALHRTVLSVRIAVVGRGTTSYRVRTYECTRRQHRADAAEKKATSANRWKGGGRRRRKRRAEKRSRKGRRRAWGKRLWVLLGYIGCGLGRKVWTPSVAFQPWEWYDAWTALRDLWWGTTSQYKITTTMHRRHQRIIAIVINSQNNLGSTVFIIPVASQETVFRWVSVDWWDVAWDCRCHTENWAF